MREIVTDRYGADTFVLGWSVGYKMEYYVVSLLILKYCRQKIQREDIVCINNSIADKERDWERKWKRILGQSPFSIFKGLNSVLELQPPLAPLSFEPATDEDLRNSVFSQYQVSLPGKKSLFTCGGYGG
ncbi:hypothetical protein GDO78_019610 [Eleutherodactylus coqui]|uniref:Uncharacterized protein n=1 Tax=Eleutherodactylus coqui TaxID=57060 RepID=A0A8J6E315_ELECQ|nr:hypothetical protein GDO78_019610 [Eleutherodactylus coqui]